MICEAVFGFYDTTVDCRLLLLTGAKVEILTSLWLFNLYGAQPQLQLQLYIQVESLTKS